MLRISAVVAALAVSLLAAVVPNALASRVTVYDSQGFDSAVLGSVDGQAPGAWHAAAGAKKWTVASGAQQDGGQIVDVGGAHGKVLSFPDSGQWADTRLRLDWSHWNVADSGLPGSVRWDLDFYEDFSGGGRADGAIVSYRNAGQVQQAKVLAVGGALRAELRRYGREEPFWPSHALESYASREWHHLTVIQNYRYPLGSDEVGEVHVYLDGVEVTTPGSSLEQWFTAWAGYVGYISDLSFNQRVLAGGRFYVDNLTVRTGEWSEMARLEQDRVQVFNSEGFERFDQGSISGQRRGRAYDQVNLASWATVSGSAANGPRIIQAGGERGKVMSFQGNGQWTTTALQTHWTGAYGTQATTVRTDFDFRQTPGCYGVVETMRNAGQVTQARVGIQNGTIQLFGRKSSTTAPIDGHVLGAYSLGSGTWHQLGVEQLQPGAEGFARIKVYLDGKELTRNETYYGQWVGWPGDVDDVRFDVNCGVGATYDVDELTVVEGPKVDGRPLPVNWLWFWGEDLEAQSGIVNTVLTNDMSVVSDAGAERVATLFDATWTFFLLGEKAWKLRSDWQVAWDTVADLVEDEVRDGQIIGFQLPDEALWQCISESDMAVAAQAIHARFPNAVVYVNEAGGPVSGGGTPPGCPLTTWSTPIPADIDWFSVDSYGRTVEDEWARLRRDFYQPHIYPRVGGRKSTIVNLSFSTNAQGSAERRRRELLVMNNASQAMVNWAMRDRQIVALDPYAWFGNQVQYEDDVGTHDLSDAKRVWESIGSTVSENNPLPTHNRFFPTQGFDSIPLVNGRRPLPTTFVSGPWASDLDPTPPPADKAFVTNTGSYSPPNSIRVLNAPGDPTVDFRYAPAVNRNSLADQVSCDRCYVDFRVKADNGANYGFEVWPIRGDGTPLRFALSPAGFVVRDANGTRLLASDPLGSGTYHRVTLYVDRPGSQFKAWLDEQPVGSGSFATLGDVSPNTVYFRHGAGATQLDDIGIGTQPPF